MFEPQKLALGQQSNLIGKAAISLTTFHLARRGYDCIATTDNSSAGDLWVKVGAGVIPIEVKGSLQNQWSVRPSQMTNSQYIAFVGVGDGRCWLLPATSVMSFIIANRPRVRHVEILTLRTVEGLNGCALHADFRAIYPIKRIPLDVEYFSRSTGRRVVRKTLADGTLKEYVYPSYRHRKSVTTTDDTTSVIV